MSSPSEDHRSDDEDSHPADEKHHSADEKHHSADENQHPADEHFRDQEVAPRVDLSVTSEVAPLEQVLVHRPGEELGRVTPENMHDLLFDDILFAGEARKEHELLCEVVRVASGENAELFEAEELFLACLRRSEAREAFVDALSSQSPHRNYRAVRDELVALSPKELLRFAFTGENPLSLEAAPAPNLMFTRDLGAVVGSCLILSHAARPARVRESLVLRTIAEYHPSFTAGEARVITLPETVTFEGGDLVVASEDTVLIGLSERTGLGGAHAVARALFTHTDVRNVLLVDLPKARASMHLDTVFTFASETECVVFPQVLEGRRFNVVHYRGAEPRGENRAGDAEPIGTDVPIGAQTGTGDDASEARTSSLDLAADLPYRAVVYPNLETALKEVLDRSLRFIPCGGSEPLDQRREQWTDGANLFAVRPGVVVGYARNERTFQALSRRGYQVIAARELVASADSHPVEAGQKLAIELDGHELSRGRGGARCLTLPLRRTADRSSA